jgi:hypothetical protein
MRGDETHSKFIESAKTTESGEADEPDKSPDHTNWFDGAGDKFDRSIWPERGIPADD